MTQKITASGVNVLPVLAALIMLCLAGAAALTLLTHDTAPITAPAEQLALVVQRIPYEAQNALRGESSAFDALAKSAGRLKTLRGAVPDSGAGTGDAAAWNKLSDAVKTVGDARAAVAAIQGSSQEARELAPKLLSELGDLA